MAVGTTTAALIAGGGAVAGGLMQRDAAGDAADAQQQANQAAIEEQRRQFDKIMELNEPFRETSIQAMNAQKDLLGLGGAGGGGGQSGQPQNQNQTVTPSPAPQPVMRGGDSPSFGRNSPLDRNRQIRNREELINNLAANPANRRQFVRNNAHRIPEDNPNRRNILRRVGG